jgi:hypothetical protein
VRRNSKSGHFSKEGCVIPATWAMRSGSIWSHFCPPLKAPDGHGSGICATSSTASFTLCTVAVLGLCCPASFRRGQPSTVTFAASEKTGHGSASIPNSIPNCVSRCVWQWAENPLPAEQCSTARASRPRKRGRCGEGQHWLRCAQEGQGA